MINVDEFVVDMLQKRFTALAAAATYESGIEGEPIKVSIKSVTKDEVQLNLEGADEDRKKEFQEYDWQNAMRRIGMNA